MLLEVAEHPQAALYSKPDKHRLIDTALSIVARNDNLLFCTRAEKVILRQTGFVNLYFFLKYLAGYANPYNKLNETLHVDMCNWRQLALVPGARHAAFIPRSCFKSTILTHGAIAWELLRNPDLRVGIGSCVFDRSLDFLHCVQRIFDSNDLIKDLYPEYIPTPSRGQRWNDVEAVMPNRSRTFPEPSVKPITAGGSTQGIHVDLMAFDDLVGDSQLNAEHASTAEMIRIKNWFFSNINTLLISRHESRVTLAATRYAMDDPYDEVMQRSSIHAGYWAELEHDYPIDPDGEWNTYYRMAIEQDTSIFPEQFSVADLQRLATGNPEERWTYQTQYMNNPRSVDSLEFINYKPYPCTLAYDKDNGWFVTFMDETSRIIEKPLSSMDLVLSLDPAGSEKYATMKTSRSAMMLTAHDSTDRVFHLRLRVDFCSPSTYFNWLFEEKNRFKELIRVTVVESQGGFKILGDLIHQEEFRRGQWLNLICAPALGDKVVSVRSIYQPICQAGKLFVEESIYDKFMEEFQVFPASSRMDILDAGKIGIKYTYRPQNDSEKLEFSEAEDWFNQRKVSSVVGY